MASTLLVSSGSIPTDRCASTPREHSHEPGRLQSHAGVRGDITFGSGLIPTYIWMDDDFDTGESALVTSAMASSHGSVEAMAAAINRSRHSRGHRYWLLLSIWWLLVRFPDYKRQREHHVAAVKAATPPITTVAATNITASINPTSDADSPSIEAMAESSAPATEGSLMSVGKG